MARSTLALIAVVLAGASPSPGPAPQANPLRMVFMKQLNGQPLPSVPRVSGTVLLEFQQEVPQVGFPGPEAVRYQVTLDERPISAILTQLPGTLNWNTTQVSDGTYALSFRILDNLSGFTYVPFPISIIVDNVPGPVTGPRKIPLTPGTTPDGSLGVGGVGPHPDWVLYPGTPTAKPGHPRPAQPGVPFTTQLPPEEMYAELMESFTNLYTFSQRFFRDATGNVASIPFNTQINSFFEPVAPILDRYALLDGPRNVGYVSAYTSGAVHPVTEALVFSEQAERHGRVGTVALDGTITTLAGYRTRSNALPYLPSDDSIPQAVRDGQYELVGQFVDGPVGFHTPMDVAIDVLDPDVVFVADFGNHRIARIDTSTQPASVTTYAGSLSGQGGYQNGNGTQARFFRPISLAMNNAGILYVADRGNAVIRRIDRNRNVTSLVGKGPLAPALPSEEDVSRNDPDFNRANYMVNGGFNQASIVYPMVIRPDSAGNLILGEEFTGTTRRINVAQGTVELLLVNPEAPEWIWIAVDREGSFGPRDHIFFASGTNSGDAIYRFMPDGAGGWRWEDMLRWGSYRFEARLDFTRGPHYAWMVTVGKGALWLNGFGTEGLLRLRKALPQDRVDDFSNVIYPIHGSGHGIYTTGTVSGFPWGSRPSFELVHGPFGWSQLDTIPNFDDLAGKSDAELEAEIHSGWGGSVPRPEITGRDLRDLIFFVRRNSLPSIRANVLPGPEPTDMTAPQILNVTTQEVGPTTLRVSWTTDEPSLGLVQFGVNTDYSRWSPIENTYATSHSAFLTDLAGGTVYNFVVLSKDLAGNLAQTANSQRSFSGGTPSTGNLPPYATFALTPASGPAPLDVRVDASRSFDRDGSALSYSWSWGDGTADGSGVAASHRYTSTGTYFVTLTLSDAQGATPQAALRVVVGSPGGGLPVVNVSATDATASEAGGNTGTFTFSRTGDTSSPLSISYTVGGSAAPGPDYVALPGSVTIPSGASSATVTVTPIDDALTEGSETVLVAVAPAAGYSVGTPSSATVTIVDDEGNADSDADGMPDAFEATHGFDPADRDQDRNGVPDGDDDWDGDGILNRNDPTPGSVPTGGGGRGSDGGCGLSGLELLALLWAGRWRARGASPRGQ